MMRRLLLPLLALGLWQIAYSQADCAFEPPDCQVGACELCHFADISPLVSGFSLPCSPPPTPGATVEPGQGATGRPIPSHNRGRAPPR